MREIEIGIRVDPDNGIQFFGVDDANRLLEGGARIVALEPGGAIMRKVGQNNDNVQLTLSGFSLKLKIADA